MNQYSKNFVNLTFALRLVLFVPIDQLQEKEKPYRCKDRYIGRGEVDLPEEIGANIDRSTQGHN
jgi:23S rRNA A2030 N6-methylase RlmJ